jgi:hypothetical protein
VRGVLRRIVVPRLTPEQMKARDRELVRTAHTALTERWRALRFTGGRGLGGARAVARARRELEEFEVAHGIPETERVPPEGVALS